MNRFADIADWLAKRGPAIDRFLVDGTVLAAVGMSCFQIGKLIAPVIMP